MYFKSVQKNNLTYSIDMLRLRTNLSVGDFSKLEYRFKTVWHDKVVKQWSSSGIADFKYNYNIEIAVGQSFWFGFLHNSEKPNQNEKSEYNFTLEFNPNKLKDNRVIKYILNLSREWVLKQFDIAIDIPISVLDICGLDKKRYKDVRTFNAGYDNKTIYVGRTNNRFKIYNKKIESNLDIVGELTRVEVTSKQNYKFSALGYFKPELNVPDLYTNNYYYTFKDYEDKTLLAILYAVQAGFNINDLTRVYKDKVKKLLKGGNHIDIDVNCIYEILNLTLKYYLVGEIWEKIKNTEI